LPGWAAKGASYFTAEKVLLNPLTFAFVRFGLSSTTQNFDMLLAPIAVLMVVFDATSAKG
jgi:hypothetical protein